MSKFNAVRKVPKSRRHSAVTIKKAKLTTELPTELIRQLESNQIVPRKNKYHKKSQSNIDKILDEEYTENCI